MSRNVVSALRAINFAELIHYDVPDPGAYSFGDYHNRGDHHPEVTAYCTACENAGVSSALDGSGFTLRNMSHGTHSEDFISSLDRPPAIRSWNSAAVLFIFECPSKNYGNLYSTVPYGEHRKRPAQEWYWIHHKHPCRAYPDSFSGGTYGDLIRSAILTFRLSNAYVTNLVKCGMNDNEGQHFAGIGAIPERCIEKCYNTFLRRELELFQPRIVFAFGSAVEHWLNRLLPHGTPLQQLPHPAGRRRGFRDEYYEVLYLWLMARALVRSGVVPEEEASDIRHSFLGRQEIEV